MANTHSKAPAIAEDNRGNSEASQRSGQCLKLQSYVTSLFSEGICNIPDSELEISDSSSNVIELVKGLLLQRTSNSAAKIKDLEDMMPLEWCGKK